MTEPPRTFYFAVPGQPTPVRAVIADAGGTFTCELSHPQLNSPMLRGMKASGAFAQGLATVVNHFDAVGVRVTAEGEPEAVDPEAVEEPGDDELAMLEARVVAADRLGKLSRELLKRSNTLWSSAISFAGAMTKLDLKGALPHHNALEAFNKWVEDHYRPALDDLAPPRPAPKKTRG